MPGMNARVCGAAQREQAVIAQYHAAAIRTEILREPFALVHVERDALVVVVGDFAHQPRGMLG